MAYVFGVDIPMFELLFIVLVVQVVGLILILFEVRKLRQLMTEEKNVITQLDEDLDRIEEEEGRLTNAKLKEYVKNAKDSGMSVDEIENVLTKRGIEENRIRKVL